MRAISPAIDPLAQKAAIEALEAQRAAYQRYARDVEAQRRSLGDGDGDRAATAASVASNGLDELQKGARAVGPAFDRAAGVAGPDQIRELQQHLDDMVREARSAESAIHNLTAQLQAWRDAYGRQLAEVGLPPGGVGSVPNPGPPGLGLPGADGGAVTPTTAAGASGYGRRGQGVERRTGPSLIDRRG